MWHILSMENIHLQLMRKLMGKFKVFAEEMDIWNPSHNWTSADVTTF